MTEIKQAVGEVQSIYISKAAGFPMQKSTEIRTVKNKGLMGDRYCEGVGFWQSVSKPRNTIRDVSFIHAADIKKSGFLEEETRRNIVVTGEFELTMLVGKTFSVGEVQFYGSEECTPCKRPSDLSSKPGFAKAFETTGGIRAQVLTDGIIKVRDLISFSKV